MVLNRAKHRILTIIILGCIGMMALLFKENLAVQEQKTQEKDIIVQYNLKIINYLDITLNKTMFNTISTENPIN